MHLKSYLVDKLDVWDLLLLGLRGVHEAQKVHNLSLLPWFSGEEFYHRDLNRRIRAMLISMTVFVK